MPAKREQQIERQAVGGDLSPSAVGLIFILVSELLSVLIRRSSASLARLDLVRGRQVGDDAAARRQ
jgi:hypothetical protein